MMKSKTLLTTLFLLFYSLRISYSQEKVRLMSWNLLNFPDADTSIRNTCYKTVLQQVQADLILTQEINGLTGVQQFLNLLNTPTIQYGCAIYKDGPDSDNMLYYNFNRFEYVSNKSIITDTRDINQFTLVYTLSHDTIHLFSVHLKSSEGSSNELKRAQEVDSLRKITDLLPTNSYYLVAGDFNIYSSNESAYQKLLQDTISKHGYFIDPISISGTWNNPAYSKYHTQSTRTRSFGYGSTGGLNDRFDMILFSPTMMDSNSYISYVSDSYNAIGNDGNHYNDSINHATNTAVSSSVANALHCASDHLPVIVDIKFPMAIGVAEPKNRLMIGDFFPQPNEGIGHLPVTVLSNEKIELTVYNPLGELVSQTNHSLSPGSHFIPIIIPDNAGIYFLKTETTHGTYTQKIVQAFH